MNVVKLAKKLLFKKM